MSGTVSLRITLRYKDLDEFVARYAENISSAGLFLRTRTPKPTGTRIRFELLLVDGARALLGEGVVVSVRHDDKPGMALRFHTLEPDARAVVDRVVAAHGEGALAPTPLGGALGKPAGLAAGWKGAAPGGWGGGLGRPAVVPSTGGLVSPATAWSKRAIEETTGRIAVPPAAGGPTPAGIPIPPIEGAEGTASSRPRRRGSSVLRPWASDEPAGATEIVRPVDPLAARAPEAAAPDAPGASVWRLHGAIDDATVRIALPEAEAALARSDLAASAGGPSALAPAARGSPEPIAARASEVLAAVPSPSAGLAAEPWPTVPSPSAGLAAEPWPTVPSLRERPVVQVADAGARDADSRDADAAPPVADADPWDADAASPVADTGSSVADAGAPVADTGSSVADAGASVADADSWYADAASPVADPASPVAHAGSVAAEAASPVAHAGSPAADAAFPVADPGSSEAHAGPPDAHAGSPAADAASPDADAASPNADAGPPVAPPSATSPWSTPPTRASAAPAGLRAEAVTTAEVVVGGVVAPPDVWPAAPALEGLEPPTAAVPMRFDEVDVADAGLSSAPIDAPWLSSGDVSAADPRPIDAPWLSSGDVSAADPRPIDAPWLSSGDVSAADPRPIAGPDDVPWLSTGEALAADPGMEVGAGALIGSPHEDAPSHVIAAPLDAPRASPGVVYAGTAGARDVGAGATLEAATNDAREAPTDAAGALSALESPAHPLAVPQARADAAPVEVTAWLDRGAITPLSEAAWALHREAPAEAEAPRDHHEARGALAPLSEGAPTADRALAAEASMSEQEDALVLPVAEQETPHEVVAVVAPLDVVPPAAHGEDLAEADAHDTPHTAPAAPASAAEAERDAATDDEGSALASASRPLVDLEALGGAPGATSEAFLLGADARGEVADVAAPLASLAEGARPIDRFALAFEEAARVASVPPAGRRPSVAPAPVEVAEAAPLPSSIEVDLGSVIAPAELSDADIVRLSSEAPPALADASWGSEIGPPTARPAPLEDDAPLLRAPDRARTVVEVPGASWSSPSGVSASAIATAEVLPLDPARTSAEARPSSIEVRGIDDGEAIVPTAGAAFVDDAFSEAERDREDAADALDAESERARAAEVMDALALEGAASAGRTARTGELVVEPTIRLDVPRPDEARGARVLVEPALAEVRPPVDEPLTQQIAVGLALEPGTVRVDARGFDPPMFRSRGVSALTGPSPFDEPTRGGSVGERAASPAAEPAVAAPVTALSLGAPPAAAPASVAVLTSAAAPGAGPAAAGPVAALALAPSAARPAGTPAPARSPFDETTENAPRVAARSPFDEETEADLHLGPAAGAVNLREAPPSTDVVRARRPADVTDRVRAEGPSTSAAAPAPSAAAPAPTAAPSLASPGLDAGPSAAPPTAGPSAAPPLAAPPSAAPSAAPPLAAPPTAAPSAAPPLAAPPLAAPPLAAPTASAMSPPLAAASPSPAPSAPSTRGSPSPAPSAPSTRGSPSPAPSAPSTRGAPSLRDDTPLTRAAPPAPAPLADPPRRPSGAPDPVRAAMAEESSGDHRASAATVSRRAPGDTRIPGVTVTGVGPAPTAPESSAAAPRSAAHAEGEVARVVVLDLSRATPRAAAVDGGRWSALEVRPSARVGWSATGTVVAGGAADQLAKTGGPTLRVRSLLLALARLSSEVALRDVEGRKLAELGDHTVDVGELLRAALAPVASPLRESGARVLLVVPAPLPADAEALVAEAARTAGLALLEVLSAPALAARAFALDPQPVESVLVVDVGDEHLDISVLRRVRDGLRPAIVRPLEGPAVGDVERAFLAFVRAEFERASPGARWDATLDRALGASMEGLRRELRAEAMIDLRVRDLTLRLPRPKLYQSIETLVARVAQLTRETLAEAGVHPRALGAVVLAGPGGALPPLAQALAALTTHEPLSGIDAEEVVEQGCVRVIDAHVGRGRTDALQLDVGIALPGGRFHALLPAGSRLPARVAKKHATTRDDQTEIVLAFHEGRGDVVARCPLLGSVTLEGLPKAARGQVQVEVELSVDAEAVLIVELSEPRSGVKKRLTAPTAQTPPDRRAALEGRAHVEELGSPARPKSKVGFLGRLLGR